MRHRRRLVLVHISWMRLSLGDRVRSIWLRVAVRLHNRDAGAESSALPSREPTPEEQFEPAVNEADFLPPSTPERDEVIAASRAKSGYTAVAKSTHGPNE